MRGWTRRDLLSAVAGTGVGLGVAGRASAREREDHAARRDATAARATQATGNWPQFGYDTRNTGHHPTATGPSGPVGAAWTRDVNADLGTTPAVVDGTVYAPALHVTAVDADTGERRWAFTDGRSGYNAPTVLEDTVYVNNEFGEVYALARADGSPRWSREVGQNSYAGVTVAGDTVLTGSSDGSLYALDRSDGSQRWATDTGSPYVTAAAVWEELVFVGSTSLFALDRGDGSVRWSVETGIAAAPVVLPGAARVVLGGSNTLYGVTFGGSVAWTVEMPDRVWGSPAAADGTVFAGSQDGTVRAVDVGSGEVVWERTVGGDLYAAPSVADGVVHLASGNTLYALSAADGETLWTFAADVDLGEQYAVADGRVYVGDANGTLYALADREDIATPTPTRTPTRTPTPPPTDSPTPTATPTDSPTPGVGSGGSGEQVVDGQAPPTPGEAPVGGVAALTRAVEDPILPVGGATVVGVLGGAALLRRYAGGGADDTEADDGDGGDGTLAPGPDETPEPTVDDAGGASGASGAGGTGGASDTTSGGGGGGSDDGPTPGGAAGSGGAAGADGAGDATADAGTDDPATAAAAGAAGAGTGSADGASGADGTGGTDDAGGTADTDGPSIERGPGGGPPETVPRAPDASLSFDDLDIGDRIGTGGSADVHRATATVDGEELTLAVKRPRFEGTLGREVLERHRSEAETWGKLDGHDNVVGLVDHGTRPVPWLAMEFMDGGDLTARIDGPSYVERLWIAHRVCEGVYHAHRHGVSHLDLKPGNVLFRSVEGGWDVPKVGDWGLSKQLLGNESAGDGLSPSYAAPEQFDDTLGPTDHATDIYQLGAVLYELFTGRPPFEGPPNRVMNATLTQAVVPPTERNPDLPDRLDEALLPALARDRDERYDSVIYLRDEMEEIARAVR